MKPKQNDEWFSIVAKNHSCQGYVPAKDKEEACKRFGEKIEDCFVERVIWNGKEFVEPDQVKQGKLL